MKKSIWNGAVALVTGGGSGIGRALSIAMSNRGTHVIVSDLDPIKASQVAAECGPLATALQLDVRDADAMKQIIENAYAQHGHFDFIFNNAGIGIAGEAYEIDPLLWHRILDINLKGVLNGIHAAYPLMVEQGFGYIINTASMAGLIPAPLMTPYAMTKHAVVGLSTSLRVEAMAKGIQVNVICPSAIDTPILDSKNPADLPEVPWTPDAKRYLTNLGGKPYPVTKMAERVLYDIERNKAIIIVPAIAKFAWLISKIYPRLILNAFHKALIIERSFR